MSLLHCTQEPGPGRIVALMDDQPQIRVDKILDIRRQLGEGTYSIEDRLDAVIDKIIDALT